MLNFLHKLIGGKPNHAPAQPTALRQANAAPSEVDAAAGAPFRFAAHLHMQNGFPILDWSAARGWVDTLAPGPAQDAAWSAIEAGWMLHMRDALGADFWLAESSHCLLLSALEQNVAKATLAYMERTLDRVVRTLDGIAEAPSMGKDLLIVFDDEDSYYRYVSHAYPDGEFALSGGMYLNNGCGHFVTVRRDLGAIEPVIAHEMTHACLAHLPIPAWLNEGLAVNTEARLAGAQAPMYTPQEMRAKHLAFWGRDEIQEFWSGHSFFRSDDGNLLSYDLARILVGFAAKDWNAFRPFVLAAQLADGGAQAAREHLGAELGEMVCALLGQAYAPDWSPAPSVWQNVSAA